MQKLPRWRGFATRALYLADYLLFICAPIANRRGVNYFVSHKG